MIALSAGIVVFHEIPDAISAIGAGLIVGSCLLSAGYANRRYSQWLWAAFVKTRPDRAGEPTGMISAR